MLLAKHEAFYRLAQTLDLQSSEVIFMARSSLGCKAIFSPIWKALDFAYIFEVIPACLWLIKDIKTFLIMQPIDKNF